MKLKDLKTGDRFYPKSKQFKATHIFEVINKHLEVSGKIRCVDLVTGREINKLGNLDVIKTLHGYY